MLGVKNNHFVDCKFCFCEGLAVRVFDFAKSVFRLVDLHLHLIFLDLKARLTKKITFSIEFREQMELF